MMIFHPVIARKPFGAAAGLQPSCSAFQMRSPDSML